MNPEENLATQTPAGDPVSESAPPLYYHWSAPSCPVQVRLHYDFIDDLNFEIMRGFGAVPRRGAEVGGILTGHVEERGRLVEITGFQAIPCRHRRGPSYILEDDELASLEEALAALAREDGERGGAVGFFRSNTRDALDLDADDLRLLERYFTTDPGLCLMVKPYATRVSEATFFYRADGAWLPAGEGSVFPFRRSSLGGGKRPRRQRQPLETSAPEMLPPPEPPLPAAPQVLPPPTIQIFDSAAPRFETERIPIPEAPEFGEAAPSRVHGGWVWIPLSFIFLLLGIVLGFQIALSVSRSQKATEQQADPYALELTAVEFGESLHLKWNNSLPAFRNASSGVLHIQDGNNTKTVEITREDISRGGILYKHASPEVLFRLEIPQTGHSSVIETLEVRVIAPSSRP